MTTPTSRRVELDHPAIRLLPSTSERFPSTSRDAPWRQGHIAAVRGHLLSSWTVLPQEARILGLLDGLDTFARSVDPEDGWTQEEFAPALYAAASLLNLDLGRLDGGTLDRWLGELFDAIRWNRDTNEAL